MTELVLLTAPDCHLCGHAKEVLDELGVPWREIRDDTVDGRRLAQGAPPLRPVLYRPDGRLLAYGRLSRRRLQRTLAREPATR